MSRPVTADDLPTFAKAASNDSNFTCIFAARTRGFQRCRNRVNAGDRYTASIIRDRVLSLVGNYAPSDEDLRKYAELCCCLRWHRSEVVEAPIMDQLVRKWQRELANTRQQHPPPPYGITDALENSQPTTTVSHPSTRATRSQTTGNRREATETALDILRFVPYSTTSTLSMSAAIAEPLSEQDQRGGILYCLSRASDTGFYKLGSTRGSLSQRRASIQRCSGPNNAVVIEYSTNTAHAYRVERLTQLELRTYRRRETRCRNYPSCVTQHREWFEINLNVMKRAMSRWSQWMNEANPYDDDGRLREPWKQYCIDLEREGTAITASVLYMAWQQGLVSTEELDSEDEAATESSEDEATPTEERAEDEECPICLDTINEPARTTCGHSFCSGCIAQVFATSNTCPMCRAQLVHGEVPTVEIAEIPMQGSVGAS